MKHNRTKWIMVMPRHECLTFLLYWTSLYLIIKMFVCPWTCVSVIYWLVDNPRRVRNVQGIWKSYHLLRTLWRTELHVSQYIFSQWLHNTRSYAFTRDSNTWLITWFKIDPRMLVPRKLSETPHYRYWFYTTERLTALYSSSVRESGFVK